MRTLEELTDTTDPAWPLVTDWFRHATNPVEVLPASRPQAEQTLLALQVTTRSPMGALAYETGGVFFDHGWLRFLGSGHPRMSGTLASWNALPASASLEGSALSPALTGGMVVAYDVMGGFFAVNGGAFEGDPGRMFYLSADTLNWEPLSLSYSDLLHWACTGVLGAFYGNMRWPDWQTEVASLNGDQVLSIYPPLWTEKGTAVAARSRHPVPATEAWGAHHEFMQQLGESTMAEGEA
jgi:hypothetical protein